MKIKGLTEDKLRAAVQAVSEILYGGNITYKYRIKNWINHNCGERDDNKKSY